MTDGWQQATKNWVEYPIGTKARENARAGYWLKVKEGWKWSTGIIAEVPRSANQVLIP